MDSNLRINVLLSVQRALVGQIAPEMRAISVEWSASSINVLVYVDSLAPLEIEENFDSIVITEITADFPYPDRGDPSVELKFIRVDPSSRISPKGELVFARSDWQPKEL